MRAGPSTVWGGVFELDACVYAPSLLGVLGLAMSDESDWRLE